MDGAAVGAARLENFPMIEFRSGALIVRVTGATVDAARVAVVWDSALECMRLADAAEAFQRAARDCRNWVHVNERMALMTEIFAREVTDRLQAARAGGRSANLRKVDMPAAVRAVLERA